MKIQQTNTTRTRKLNGDGDTHEVTLPLSSVAAMAQQAPVNKPYVTHSGTMTKRPPAAPEDNAAVVQPKIQVSDPGTVDSTAQLDSRFIDITDSIPSRMGFYDFDRLSIRPFSLLDVQKMHRAITEGSLRYQVDTIASCLDHSPYDLTWGDYQFVQYWIFINSYKKHPKTINFSCTNPDHIAWVSDGVRPDPSDPAKLIDIAAASLDNTHTIVKDDLQSGYLDLDIANDFLRKFNEEYGLFLWAPRIVDLVEIESDLKRTAQDQHTAGSAVSRKAETLAETMNPKTDGYNVNMDYANRYAVLLNPRYHGKTLAERRKFFLEFSNTAAPDLAVDMLTWESICAAATVKQFVNPVCKECGHVVGNVPYRIDPLAFLPNASPN